MKINIIPDPQPPNPRQDFEPLGKMLCFHARYDLGDKHSIDPEGFETWDEMRAYLIKTYDNPVLLPLYLYDHSGITISTHPFSDPWDSGQVGFILATREDIREWCNIKRVTAQVRARVVMTLKAEVEEYDQYLRGDIYGYQVLDDNDEEIDSCWGFYGSDPETNGMAEYLPENWRASI